MKKQNSHFFLVLIITSCVLLALACRSTATKPDGLQLNQRASDGSLSGSYSYGSDRENKSIQFSVTADGLAFFQLEDAPETETLVVNYSLEAPPAISWQGKALDGLGVLSSEEQQTLEDLLESDLAHALAMIPLDIACQTGESIDPAQVAALLYPLQLRFKYQIADRAQAASELVALSQCDYDPEVEDEETSQDPTIILISPSSPVPVVMGYFPFDADGANEPTTSAEGGVKMACLDAETWPITSSIKAGSILPAVPLLDDEPIQNEWGPCEAKCRGACGPDCTFNNCSFTIEERCEKNQDGDNDGFFSLVHVYDCGLHPACVKHDACYDDCNQRHGCNTWAASVCMHAGVADLTAPWASILGLNISCDKITLNEENPSSVKDWMRGYGPQPERQIFEYHDKTVRFEYDPITCPLPTEQEEAPEADVEKTVEVATEPATSTIPIGTYQGAITENTWEEGPDREDAKGSYTKNEVIIMIAEDGSVSGTVDYTYVSVPLVDSAGCSNTLTYDGWGEFTGTLEEPQGAIELDMVLNRSVNYSCDDRGTSDTVEMVYPFSIQVEGNQMKGTSTIRFPNYKDPDKSWILSFTAEKP